MPRIPLSVWAKVGEYAMYGIEAYVAHKRASSPTVAPSFPAGSVPVAPPSAAPEPPVDPRTLAQKWEDPVQDLAVDILGYVLTDPNELRGYYKLMDRGDREGVVRDLIHKLEPEKQPAARARYGMAA